MTRKTRKTRKTLAKQLRNYAMTGETPARAAVMRTAADRLETATALLRNVLRMVDVGYPYYGVPQDLRRTLRLLTWTN